MRFIVDPMPKPRMTAGDKANYRPVTQKYWAYKDELVIQANQVGFVLPDSFVAIFYVAMPKSWSKKKRLEMRGKPHQQAPDLDNMQKGLVDCLLSDNDTSVWFCISAKIWDDTGSILVYTVLDSEKQDILTRLKIEL